MMLTLSISLLVTIILLITSGVSLTSAMSNLPSDNQLQLAGHSSSPMTLPYHFKWTNLPGYFAQDDPATNPLEFDYVQANLGLLNRSYPTDAAFDPLRQKTQWQRFAHFVHHLHDTAPRGTSYKLLYLGRHGQGWHNVQEAKVGTPLWDCYWSRLDGDGHVTWANAELTDIGINQALVANSFWKASLLPQGAALPLPQTYYVSPLQRCLQTANVTFSDLALPHDRPFRPVIKELLREALGVHTCDRRDTRSEISSLWPDYSFEHHFAQADCMWDPDLRESHTHQVYRLQTLLDDIFFTNSSPFLSLTSHSGAIASILEGVGHIPFSLQTGAVIPVFLKGEFVENPRSRSGIDPPTRPDICEPPDGATLKLQSKHQSSKG